MPSNEKSATQRLSFCVGDHEYAVPIGAVREIVPFGELTRMPQMPPAFRGVANLRGSVVPVIDLSLLFGGGATEATRFASIVILDMEIEGEQRVLGLLVDSVRQVLESDPASVQATPSFGTPIRRDLLCGLLDGERGAVYLLELEKMLSPEELLGLEAGGETTLASAAWEGPLDEPSGGVGKEGA